MMKRLAATLALALGLSHGALAEPTQRVFVTNEADGSVTVIDARTNKVEKTIEDVGPRPRGIGLSPDRSELYVALSGEWDGIAVIDPKTLEVVRKFEAGAEPETFAVHPTSGNLYISIEDAALAAVYTPQGELVTEIQVGLEPEGVAVSKDGTRVAVTAESSNMVHIIAVPEHEIIANIVVGARPRDAVFTADGSILYATSEISGEVNKIDMTSFELVEKVYLGDDRAKPMGLALVNDEKSLYVAGGRANAIYVIDTDTMKVKKSIPVGKRVWGVAKNRDGSRIYTTDGVSHQVSVIDTAKNEVIATIPVGQMPWGVVVDD